MQLPSVIDTENRFNVPLQAGEVALIGAGPGDPELLTLRAIRLMQQADVVVYDRLVSVEVMAMVRQEAELLYVGKSTNDHSVPQHEINSELVRLAKEKLRVVRIKGGDPFIFGRGGEEVEALAKEGVPCRVVPGITAASGCTTYAGIPLTHRDYAQSVTFVTGHLKRGDLELPWDCLAKEAQTVVFYMGLKNASVISSELQKRGMSGEISAVIIEKGTSKDQRIFPTNLASLAKTISAYNITPPALMVVGEVTSLANIQHIQDATGGIEASA